MVNNNQDPESYFLSLTREAATWSSGRTDMDEDEEAPTELNTINSSGGFMVVSCDKLSLKYTGVDLHGHDVGVVQANRPAPTKRLVYYFEIHVKNAGEKGQIAIGFTNDTFNMRRQPGWEANSYGYHGDDGKLYHGKAQGEDFGPTYTTGDIVGGGIIYSSQEFFFTKNGELLESKVKKNMIGPVYPTIAVHSQNEEVSVNFGKQPFRFNIKAFEAEERMKQQATVQNIDLPPNVSYGIIRSYLLHYGYEDTLRSFEVAGSNSIPPMLMNQENGFNEQDIEYELSNRKILRQLIRNGEIDLALNQLQKWYPQLLQDDRSVGCFLLQCQKFIELVRVGKLEEAVTYGRDNLRKYFGIAGYEDLVKECIALLAYEKAEKSGVGYLMEESQRERVADTVNAMILSTNPNVKKEETNFLHSYLERLLMQLTACSLEKRVLNGDQGGESFNLHSKLTSSSSSIKC